jgi:hypothetical protein
VDIPLSDHAALDAAHLEAIRQRIAPRRTLEHLHGIANIIAQDEFTLDVIVPLDGGLTLVYAIT